MAFNPNYTPPPWQPKSQSMAGNLNLSGTSFGQLGSPTFGVDMSKIKFKAPKAPNSLSTGQKWLGGIGAGLDAINLGMGIWGQVMQQKNAAAALEKADKQLTIENNRWDEREKERKANNDVIAASANAYTLPTERL